MPGTVTNYPNHRIERRDVPWRVSTHAGSFPCILFILSKKIWPETCLPHPKHTINTTFNEVNHMNVLVIGGAGRVASIVLPYLKQHHAVRVFDLKPPSDETLDYVVGNVGDIDAMTTAAQGMDAVLYMAMGSLDWNSHTGRHSAFDVNVKGVYLALYAAHLAGVTHAVYCSSMSVYDGELARRYFYDEDLQPDGRDLYGFTKHMGELVCRNAHVHYGMSANALRLCLPISDEDWKKNDRTVGMQIIATAASDVAAAMHAALNYHNGFQAFMISGNHEQTVMNMAKAKRVLGWEPKARQ